MKTANLAVLVLAALGGGDEEKAFRALQAGDHAAAMQEFEAVIAADGPTPERCYNLALAAWRAGKPDVAEKAAEQVARLSDGKLAHLRDGILGALRYEKARAESDVTKALRLAEDARDAFERGALAPGAGSELARNLERALALVAELTKKKREEEEQKKDEEKKDEPDSRPHSKPSPQPESKPSSRPESRTGSRPREDGQPESRPQSSASDSEPASPASRPEPREPMEPAKADPEDARPGSSGEPREPKPAAGEKAAKPPLPKNLVPGEAVQGALSPEETKRLLDVLQQMAEEKAKLRARQQAARPKVDRDW